MDKMAEYLAKRKVKYYFWLGVDAEIYHSGDSVTQV